MLLFIFTRLFFCWRLDYEEDQRILFKIQITILDNFNYVLSGHGDALCSETLPH